MINILLSIIFSLVFVSRFNFLRSSSINRLFAFPMFIILFSNFFSYVFNSKFLSFNEIQDAVLAGYIIYQIVNLATTSRRFQQLMKLSLYFKNNKDEVLERIVSLIKANILFPKGSEYIINKNLLFYIMLLISKLVINIKINFYK